MLSGCINTILLPDFKSLGKLSSAFWTMMVAPLPLVLDALPYGASVAMASARVSGRENASALTTPSQDCPNFFMLAREPLLIAAVWSTEIGNAPT